MAVRAPLFVNGSNQLQEMTTSQVTEIVDHITYQYGLNPSVTITVGSTSVSATTHFPDMNDTRFLSGEAAQGSGNGGFGTGNEFPDSTNPVLKDPIPFNRMTRTFNGGSATSPTSDTGTTFPVYYTGGSDGHVRAMTLQDMKDTFFHPAIEKLIVAGSGFPVTGLSDTASGTYIITNNNIPLSGFSLVSSNPVFIDTNADTASFVDSTIPTAGNTRDFPTNHQVYYLHIKDEPTEPTYTAPVFINGSNNLQQYSTANFGALTQGWIRDIASNSTDGYQIQYFFGSSGGNIRGSVADSRLETSAGAQVGEQRFRFVGANDYRTQDRPSGSSAIKTTHVFRITRG